MITGLTRRLKPIVDTLFPHGCIVCGRTTGSLVCGDCRATIHSIQEPFCTQCGKPFTSTAGVSHLCYDCIKGRNVFARSRTAFVYNGSIVTLIHRFKFGDQVNLAAFFSGELLRLCQAHFSDEDVGAIIPVPLSLRRLKHRSYNQSYLISERLSPALSVPVYTSVLKKIKETKPQSRLSAREREQNVKGAYRVMDHHLIRGKKVLLIDDVITTGATVNACSRALLRAGAQAVYVAAVAMRV